MRSKRRLYCWRAVLRALDNAYASLSAALGIFRGFLIPQPELAQGREWGCVDSQPVVPEHFLPSLSRGARNPARNHRLEEIGRDILGCLPITAAVKHKPHGLERKVGGEFGHFAGPMAHRCRAAIQRIGRVSIDSRGRFACGGWKSTGKHAGQFSEFLNVASGVVAALRPIRAEPPIL